MMMRAWASGWLRDRRGGVLVVVGLSAPILALAVAATVEYGSLAARRAKLQMAADSTALAGTQQLRLSNNTDAVIDSVVRSTIRGLAPTPQGSVTSVTSHVADKRASVEVDIHETVPSMMGRLLSLPTMELGVAAAARISGNAKLCLLTLDASTSASLYLDKDSIVTANGCALYANSTNKSAIQADKNASAVASMICSAGGISNKGASLSPTPTTDCPVLTDPLASLPRPNVGSCIRTALKVTASQTLWPGRYCAGIAVSGSAKVTLMPGIYVIDNGPLVVTNTASLSGQNVGLFFTGNAGGLRFDPDTTINLTAPKDGQMAGLLFFEDRSVSAPVALPLGPLGSLPLLPAGSPPMRSYQITSNNAANLLGTIYLPAGRLVIDASKPVAAKSAYTVIVARQLELNSGPNLYLNTDYGATDIPVPDGVGPKSGNISLTD